MIAKRIGKTLAATLLALAVALGVMHVVIIRRARLVPPHVELPAADAKQIAPGFRQLGRSWTTHRGKLIVVHLEGAPATIGYSHARLLYPEMVDNEGVMWGLFRQNVSRPARVLLLDLAQLRYHAVDQGMSPARRQEIAAGARGFAPDPYTDLFPTYQRFVYLNALYDIALSFEHSPLIGCTTVTLSGGASADGGTLLGRAFDFEAAEIFDEQKAVFLVHERGKIPFASVAWPGLVGVVSGMNAEGVAVVVHGGRAGQPRAEGEPVVHALRRVLSTTRTTDEAIAALAQGQPMVSHIVIVSDAGGHAAVVERVPGRPQFVRFLAERAVTTNHFEGPSAGDPANQRVRATTSSVPRRKRGDELIAALHAPATAADAVRLLRDRRGVGGVKLALGDRRAIDALIATHGVVMDTAARVLWVSESPHLLGRFVAFDLKRMLRDDYDPRADSAPLQAIPEDPLLTSGEYARWRAAHPPSGALKKTGQ